MDASISLESTSDSQGVATIFIPLCPEEHRPLLEIRFLDFELQLLLTRVFSILSFRFEEIDLNRYLFFVIESDEGIRIIKGNDGWKRKNESELDHYSK